MRIVSTSDVPGGNHSLSLRRRDVVVGDRRLSLIEKMPTIESAARVALNARELWLYERYFRGRRLGFLPEFYGSCSEGSLTQMVFEHVAGARPDLKLPRASGSVLAALGEINAVSLPEEIPFESWALTFMDPERIGKRAASMSKDHDLGDFPRNLPLHDARYRGPEAWARPRRPSRGKHPRGRPRPGLPDRLVPVGRPSGRLRLRQVHAGRRVPQPGDLRSGSISAATRTRSASSSTTWSSRPATRGSASCLSVPPERQRNRRRREVTREILHHVARLGAGQ